MSRAQNAGEIALLIGATQPSATSEIVRVECAKCMRLRCWLVPRNAGEIAFCMVPRLRRSCVSRAGNAGEIAFFVWFEGCLRTWLICVVLFARYAGKILQRLRKRSCWKCGFKILSFCESLVENAPFGRFHSQFLRKSRGKRSF